MGSTVVSFTASDDANHTASRETDVVVRDVTAATVACGDLDEAGTARVIG